jgi:hypothetical protein
MELFILEWGMEVIAAVMMSRSQILKFWRTNGRI